MITSWLKLEQCEPIIIFHQLRGADWEHAHCKVHVFSDAVFCKKPGALDSVTASTISGEFKATTIMTSDKLLRKQAA